MTEEQKTRPIKKGDRVVIKPEWLDPGDETLAWIACENEDGGRVPITPINLGLTFLPRQTIKTDMLESIPDVRVFVVFSASEALVTEDGAGFWSNSNGWTTLQGATKFDEPGGLLPVSAGNDAVWMAAPYGLNYMVVEVEQEPGTKILFDCWAENLDHAKEQAQNAYPGCRVFGTNDDEIEPFKLAIDAFACDEYADDPGYATLTVDQGFLDQLARLHGLCVAEHLESATVSMGPDAWGNEDELLLRGDSLNVWRDRRFWFSAKPKHADYIVETRSIDISSFRRIARAGADVPTEDDHFKWSKGVLYFSGDPGQVNDLIELLEDAPD